MTTHELAPPLLNTAPHQRENIGALDRFNVHRSPIRGQPHPGDDYRKINELRLGYLQDGVATPEIDLLQNHRLEIRTCSVLQPFAGEKFFSSERLQNSQQ
ncbi:hypothetical protein TNCV_2492051 [Trichonephila clavipes]|nr:hypothetical protein TNCV_2492051 [Trichonephila clavipes]